MTPDSSVKVTTSLLKNKLRLYNLDRWQRSWTLSSTGRLTYQIFPRISLLAAFSHIQQNRDRKLLIRCATGHFPVNAYLHRFKLSRTDQCPYCGESETVQHLLLNCSRFSYLRFQFMSQLKLHVLDVNFAQYFLDPRINPLASRILSLRYNDNFVGGRGKAKSTLTYIVS